MKGERESEYEDERGKENDGRTDIKLVDYLKHL
jgi:hypothetical protein